MHDQLIGYLLEALEAEETVCLERILEVDIEARRNLDTLRTALEPLQGDRKHVEAPATLAVRTCQRIRQVRRLDQR